MGWTPPRYSKFSTVANTTVATLQLVANQPYLYANSESTNRLHVRSSDQAPFPPLRTLQPDACSPGLITIFWLHVFTTSARACTPGPQGARKKLWSGDRQPPSSSLVPRHQIFRARPAALSKNLVWGRDYQVAATVRYRMVGYHRHAPFLVTALCMYCSCHWHSYGSGFVRSSWACLASWMILFKLRCVLDPSPRGRPKDLHTHKLSCRLSCVISAIISDPGSFIQH